MSAVLDGVYLRWVILGAGNHLQLFRQRVRFDDERMVTHDFERARQILEDAGTVMGHAGRLAVHQSARAHHLPAVCLANGLVSKADAENWNGLSPAAECRDADTRFRRGAGARR